MISRISMLIVLGALLSCGDTAEQLQNRQKLRDDLQTHTIKKITDDQIVTQSMELGKKLTATLSQKDDDSTFWLSAEGSHYLDSVSRQFTVEEIRFLSLTTIPDLDYHTLEIQLWEAYQYSAENNLPLQANVQMLDDDLVLFTDPLTSENGLQGIWSIKQSKKALIRAMD